MAVVSSPTLVTLLFGLLTYSTLLVPHVQSKSLTYDGTAKSAIEYIVALNRLRASFDDGRLSYEKYLGAQLTKATDTFTCVINGDTFNQTQLQAKLEYELEVAQFAAVSVVSASSATSITTDLNQVYTLREVGGSTTAVQGSIHLGFDTKGRIDTILATTNTVALDAANAAIAYPSRTWPLFGTSASLHSSQKSKSKNKNKSKNKSKHSHSSLSSFFWWFAVIGVCVASVAAIFYYYAAAKKGYYNKSSSVGAGEYNALISI